MVSHRGSRKCLRPMALLALAFAALQAWTSDSLDAVADADAWQRQLEANETNDALAHSDVPPEFSVCGRAVPPLEATDLTPAQLEIQRAYATCPQYTPETPVVYLAGHQTYGRTANHLKSLQNALQYARDHEMELAIDSSSWAMDVLLQFFMASDEAGGWEGKVEDELCVKVVHSPEDLAGRDAVAKSSLEMFYYISDGSQEEYVASQLHTLRTLFQNCNDGKGLGNHGALTRDTCSGINSVFGIQNRTSATYSVVHMRYMEGKPGIHLLSGVSQLTGCDHRAGLEMGPEYVKSILKPLGMLNHPILVITDGQVKFFLHRLMTDPDIGPMLRVVPERASWIGGDITLATMANVFIGNPASSFSAFIARSRVALGLKDNYIFLAKKNGRWETTCGDECLFRRGRSLSESELQQKQGVVHDKRFSKHTARMAADRRKAMKWLEGRGG